MDSDPGWKQKVGGKLLLEEGQKEEKNYPLKSNPKNDQIQKLKSK